MADEEVRFLKLVTYRAHSQEQIGVLSSTLEEIYPLKAFGIRAQTMEQFIIESDRAALEQLKKEIERGTGEAVLRSKVELLAPIPTARQSVICMQDNYYRDYQEKAQAIKHGTVPKWPTYYYKKATLANRPGGEIPSYPGYAGDLDSEPGVAMITAADIRAIPEQETGKYIFGYMILNNIISRELTQKFRRPVVSTSLDGFLPMGPWITTADEFEENPIFDIETTWNGKVVQSAKTDLMKFSPNHVVSDLCQYSILKAASIIWMGSPFGCGRDRTPAQYLAPGDVISCTVSHLGTLTNTVR